MVYLPWWPDSRRSAALDHSARLGGEEKGQREEGLCV